MMYSQSAIAAITQTHINTLPVEDRPLFMGIDDNGIIRGTNYWTTNFNALGYVFILALEHTVVLFAPDSLKEELCKEIEGAMTIELNHGQSAQDGGIESLEVIFDDHSTRPYCLQVSVEQQAQIAYQLEAGFKSFSVVFSDGTSLAGPAFITINLHYQQWTGSFRQEIKKAQFNAPFC